MVAPNALIAAAQVLTGSRPQDPSKQTKPWQNEAWMFYDENGPLRYATNWQANLISRARLMAAQQTTAGDEPEPVEDGPVAEAVAVLAGGINGQSQMLKSATVHLTVPGISYLVGEGGKGKDPQTWQIYSADVLRIKAARTRTIEAVYELQEQEGEWRPLEADSLVVKVWRRHERFHWEPDSPARAALTPLRELRRIAQYIDATLVSRLSGAGILVIPQEASYPTADDGEEDAPHPFVTEIMEAMMTAVKEPGSAAQVVPIPVEIPGDMTDSFKHITFATELTDKILDMRESALRLCATTLDVPAEVLTGMGDVNHWGQWQIEESAVKGHAEPLLELITSGLTKGFLHPVLMAQGMSREEAETFVIWADTSELSTKPDKSDDAIALYDRGEASGDAVRRETGLSDADKPSDEELASWAYKQAIKAGSETITLGMQGLGIEVPESAIPPPPAEAPGNTEEPVGTNGEVSEEGAPDPQENEESFDLRTLLVLEGFINRALERAGNRLRSRFRDEPSIKDCAAERVHTCLGGTDTVKYSANELLVGCWAKLPSVAIELGLDPVQVTSCLEEFCVTLLSKGFAYERDNLRIALAAVRPSKWRVVSV